MLPEIPHEELAAVLDSIAAEVIARAAVAEPPVDAIAIARALGLTVVWDDQQSGRARRAVIGGGALAPGAASICLRHDPRPERLQWAVAHEIGESLAESVFRQIGVDPHEAPRQAREQIANAMAGRLLLPQELLVAEATASNWDLFQLKERFATASHELIARRMLDFSTPVIVGVYDQNRITWRKANFGGRVAKPSPHEIDLRRQAHDDGQVAHFSGPPTIRIWPIHEPTWKREIVRVEIDEFAE